MFIVGGIVGDLYSGCYNVVWGSFFVYIVGIGMIFLLFVFFDCFNK